MEGKGTPHKFETTDHPPLLNKMFEPGSETAPTKRGRAAVPSHKMPPGIFQSSPSAGVRSWKIGSSLNQKLPCKVSQPPHFSLDQKLPRRPGQTQTFCANIASSFHSWRRVGMHKKHTSRKAERTLQFARQYVVRRNFIYTPAGEGPRPTVKVGFAWVGRRKREAAMTGMENADLNGPRLLPCYSRCGFLFSALLQSRPAAAGLVQSWSGPCRGDGREEGPRQNTKAQSCFPSASQ